MRHRQAQGERAARPRLARHLYLPTVGAHDERDDAESQADAGGLARQALIDTIKTPEDPFLFVRRNAGRCPAPRT